MRNRLKRIFQKVFVRAFCIAWCSYECREHGREVLREKKWEEYSEEIRNTPPNDPPLWVVCAIAGVLISVIGIGAWYMRDRGYELLYIIEPMSWFYRDMPLLPLDELRGPLIFLSVVGLLSNFLAGWFHQGKPIHPKVSRAAFLCHDFIRHRINAFRQWRIVMAARGFVYSAGLSICRVGLECQERPIGLVYFKTAKGEGESRRMKFCSRHNPLESGWSKMHFATRRWEITGTFFFEKSSEYYYDIPF